MSLVVAGEEGRNTGRCSSQHTQPLRKCESESKTQWVYFLAPAREVGTPCQTLVLGHFSIVEKNHLLGFLYLLKKMLSNIQLTWNHQIQPTLSVTIIIKKYSFNSYYQLWLSTSSVRQKYPPRSSHFYLPNYSMSWTLSTFYR